MSRLHREQKEGGKAKGPHGAMGLYQGFLSPFSLLLSPRSFSLSLSLIIALHFFRRRDTSQSRNSKLLNYFPIVVATDHVCNGVCPGSIRIESTLPSGVFTNQARRSDEYAENTRDCFFLRVSTIAILRERDITIHSLSCGYNLVCLVVCLLAIVERL